MQVQILRRTKKNDSLIGRVPRFECGGAGSILARGIFIKGKSIVYLVKTSVCGTGKAGSSPAVRPFSFKNGIAKW